MFEITKYINNHDIPIQYIISNFSQKPFVTFVTKNFLYFYMYYTCAAHVFYLSFELTILTKVQVSNKKVYT